MSIIDLELSKYRRVRIWTSPDFADAFIGSELRLKCSWTERDKFASFSKGLVVIEVSIPLGGRTVYGLLGVRFTPGDEEIFSVEVPFSEPTGRRFKSSTYQGLDGVYTGLPEYYANSVIKSVEEYFNREEILPKGKIVFEYGAYSDVGSNEKIFGCLGILIIDYLFAKRALETEKDFKNLFDKFYS